MLLHINLPNSINRKLWKACTIVVLSTLLYILYYVITYSHNGLGHIPFEKANSSSKLTNISAVADNVDWPELSMPLHSEPKKSLPATHQWFKPLRFIDFELRLIAKRLGLSDYHPIQLGDGNYGFFWIE